MLVSMCPYYWLYQEFLVHGWHLFSSYCDESDPVGQQPRGQAVLVSSNRLTHRFAKTPLEFQSSPNGSRASVEITVDKSMTFQTVFGWGGAFTDATGINIAKLSSTVQNELIRQDKIDFSKTSGLMWNCIVDLTSIQPDSTTTLAESTWAGATSHPVRTRMSTRPETWPSPPSRCRRRISCTRSALTMLVLSM